MLLCHIFAVSAVSVIVITSDDVYQDSPVLNCTMVVLGGAMVVLCFTLEVLIGKQVVFGGIRLY